MANVTRAARKAALGTWLNLITATDIGDGDGATVYWSGEPVGWQADPHIMATLPQGVTLGTDERIDEYDATQAQGSEMRQYQTGQRQVTLSVQIWSFQATGDVDAAAIASRIRNRIRMRDWSSYFSTAQLGFAAFVTDTAITNPVDERDHTARQLDILFNGSSAEEGAAVGYIETIEDATFESPEGTERWVGDFTI